MRQPVFLWLLVLVVVVTADDKTNEDDKDEPVDDGAVGVGSVDDDPDDADHSFLPGDLIDLIYDGDDVKNELLEMPNAETKLLLNSIIADIDADGDQKLAEDELENWINAGGAMLRDDRTAEDFRQTDADDDSKVTWSECLQMIQRDQAKLKKELSAEEVELQKRIHANYKEIFEAADEDKDGQLTAEEYVTFSQPDKSKKMHPLMLKQALERYDKDNDGKLSYDEFSEFKDDDYNYDEFVDEDDDNDNMLNEVEIIQWLGHNYQTDLYQVLDHLFGVDDNGDGMISFSEMQEEPEYMKHSPVLAMGVRLQKMGNTKDNVKDEL